MPLVRNPPSHEKLTRRYRAKCRRSTAAAPLLKADWRLYPGDLRTTNQRSQKSVAKTGHAMYTQSQQEGYTIPIRSNINEKVDRFGRVNICSNCCSCIASIHF